MMKMMHAFSLLELLICLSISAIILSLAAPSLQETAQHNKKIQSVNQLLGILQFARENAVFGRSTTAICAGTGTCSATLTWRKKLLVFTDSNQNGQLDLNEQVLRTDSLPADISWHWSNFRNRNFLQYEQNGTTRALNGILTLCRNGEPLHQIVINLAGRLRTQAPPPNTQCF
jgi:type IV fimbrial biogenesis protein FimT